MCVLIFSTHCVSHIFILEKIKRDITNVHKFSREVPAILFIVLCNLKFLDRFAKNTQI